MPNSKPAVAVVIPNWNGRDKLKPCLDSLLAQTVNCRVIVVENGSVDGSLEYLKQNYPSVTVLAQSKNLGFAGGVNVGILDALEKQYEFIALLNNDAVADKNWLKQLTKCLDNNLGIGIATCKFLSANRTFIDSTGDLYTIWGLPFPRGRGEADLNKYDGDTNVFGASGGASMYRGKMLEQIGLFDEDFFAYYEDVDLSFRAQLAGWRVGFVPTARAYHQIGATSSKLKGFTTYQTIKNLPLVFIKNVPSKFLWRIGRKFFLAYLMFVGRAISRGQFVPVCKALFVEFYLFPKKLVQRHNIQSTKVVSSDYIWSIIHNELPPNAKNLRKLRGLFKN